MKTTGVLPEAFAASISRFSRSEIDTIGELLSVAVISMDPTFGRQGSPSDWSSPESNRAPRSTDAVRLGADNGCHRSGTGRSHGVGRPGCRRSGPSGVGLPDRHIGIRRSAAFDRDLEVVVLVLDQLHRGVESADAHDAIPVANVTVVEHQVARGCVVADITDVWVGSCWCAVRRQPPRKCRNLLDVV